MQTGHRKRHLPDNDPINIQRRLRVKLSYRTGELSPHLVGQSYQPVELLSAVFHCTDGRFHPFALESCLSAFGPISSTRRAGESEIR